MNLYQILGVSKDADQKAIKTAYRKLAMDNHPDRGGDVELMQQIQNAYDVLSDPKRRERYDLTGDEKPGPDYRMIAISMLAGVFSEILSGDMRFDIIEAARDVLAERKSQCTASLKQANNMIAKLEKSRARVVSKSGGECIFAMVVEQQIGQIRPQIAQLDESLIVLDEGVKLLDDHEDTAPQKREMVMPEGFASHSSLIEAMMRASRGRGGSMFNFDNT